MTVVQANNINGPTAAAVTSAQINALGPDVKNTLHRTSAEYRAGASGEQAVKD